MNSINSTSEPAKAPFSKVDKPVFFGLSLHSWENAMVGFLIIAGVFALLASLATWAVVSLQRIEIAESNARQKEAELKLEETRERLGRPRHADEETFLNSIKNISPAPTSITISSPDPDTYWLSFSLLALLEKAKWPIIGTGTMAGPVGQTPPKVAGCAGKFGGVTVLASEVSEDEARTLGSDQPATTPPLGLWYALKKAIGKNEVGFATCPFVPKGQLHLVVSAKWVVFPASSVESTPK